MFSQTNYLEEDSKKKIIWFWRKLIAFLNIRFLCKNKGFSKKYCPFIILIMSSKHESINLKLLKHQNAENN